MEIKDGLDFDDHVSFFVFQPSDSDSWPSGHYFRSWSRWGEDHKVGEISNDFICFTFRRIICTFL